VINHSLERIQAVELAPFRAAIQADVKAIITAHILFSELDTQQPATLSSIILTDLLRQQMGFTGVIITDAMDMDAVARLGARESVQMALNAGADLILLGHLRDQLAMFDDLRSMAHPAALERIQALRTSTLGPDPALDVVGCIEHRQIAQTIADRSITLVKNTVQAVPLHPNSDTTIAVITPQPLNLTPADTSALVNITLANAIRRRHPRVTDYQLASQNDIAAILEATRQANIVVVGTICAEQDAVQAELVQALLARGQHPIVVSLRTPYDLIAFPQIETYLCAYGIRDVTTEAVARVLFGEIEAAGILPCPIPNL
jgi:beta-N-acetylhexosaminidase